MNNRDQLISDLAAPALLLLIMALYAMNCLNFAKAPFEDAAILMRYAEHFAQGHGIVWNIGEKPVDGATDFLFMITIGLLVKAGVGLEFATRSSAFVAHGLTVLLVYYSLRSLFKVGSIPAFFVALYLAIGPALSYIAAYFGTPYFAFFASLSWYFALRMIMGEVSLRSATSFAGLSLITSLIRPEGVILTLLMLAAIVVMKGWKPSAMVVGAYIGLFLLIGGAYFFWRWSYFGYPLPNPLYKKGGLRPASLFFSVKLALKMCLPVLPSFLYGLYQKSTRRLAIAFFIPVIGFVSAFMFLSEEMNFGARFQYAVLPVVLMAWPPLLGKIFRSVSFPTWGVSKIKSIVYCIVLFLIVVVYQYRTQRFDYFKDGRYDVAKIMSEYKDEPFALATSEAGLLPLYSGWRTIDAWGLNDQWIAHNGRVTEEYIAAFKPDVIMFRAEFSPVKSFQGGSKEILEMVLTLKAYAEKHNYILAAAYGDNPQVAHYYYIRIDFPEASELVARIRNVPYYWYDSGNKAVNYAVFQGQ